MSTRMELEDLPPRYRAQAEAQIARRTRGKCTPAQQTLADAAKSAGKIGRTFESRGEYEYYMSVVIPGIESGRIIKATPHVAFPLLPQKEYCGIVLPAARYTADYLTQIAAYSFVSSLSTGLSCAVRIKPIVPVGCRRAMCSSPLTTIRVPSLSTGSSLSGSSARETP